MYLKVEPTTKLYLYHLLGNDKVELTGNKEEYWNNHLDTLQRIYDSESDEDDNEVPYFPCLKLKILYLLMAKSSSF